MTLHRKIQTLILILFVSLTTTALAHNKVVVIPMAGDDPEPLQNIVTVAIANGDFTDPLAAMASITDASEENPYLVVIGPGFYPLSEQLVMKRFVDITGSGAGLTHLYGSIGGSSTNEQAALVVGADDSRLSHLSIQNAGDGSQSFLIGLFNESESPTIDNVSITVEDGNTGAIGILNRDSTALISNSNVSVFASSLAAGISNDASQPTILQTKISAQTSGLGSLGITNASGSFATIRGANISLSGTSETRIGISNTGATSSSRVSNSVITGATNAINAGNGTGSNETYLSNLVIEGSIIGNPRCSFVFLSDGTEFDSNCTAP